MILRLYKHWLRFSRLRRAALLRENLRLANANAALARRFAVAEKAQSVYSDRAAAIVERNDRAWREVCCRLEDENRELLANARKSA